MSKRCPFLLIAGVIKGNSVGFARHNDDLNCISDTCQCWNDTTKDCGLKQLPVVFPEKKKKADKIGSMISKSHMKRTYNVFQALLYGLPDGKPHAEVGWAPTIPEFRSAETVFKQLGEETGDPEFMKQFNEYKQTLKDKVDEATNDETVYFHDLDIPFIKKLIEELKKRGVG